MNDDIENDSFLARVQHRLRAGSERVEQARHGWLARVRQSIGETVAPAVEHGARKLLLKLAEPDNAERLQETLAGLAQFAMRSGFRSDPKARLLFDFVDEIEAVHSREAVMQIVVQHAVAYEHDMLGVLLESVQRGGSATMTAERLDGFRQRASSKLLALLCALASLESDEQPPSAREAQIAYFEDAPIDPRYKPLARMAVGDETALASVEGDEASDGNRSKGVLGRTLERLRRDESAEGDLVTRSRRCEYLCVLPTRCPRHRPHTPHRP